MSFIQTDLGLEYEAENFYLLFGNKNATTEKLSGVFSDLKFYRIKQVHGNNIIEANQELVEADAHYVKQKKSALVVATADCLPVMIYDSKTQSIAAIHAGWRGVVNKIIPLTVRRLVEQGAQKKDLQFFVGPHIMQESFEIDKDVKDQLLSSVLIAPRIQVRNEKFYLSLLEIIRQQLAECEIQAHQLCHCEVDTKTSLNWHSFRRDREGAGRNLSFIFRK